MGIEKNMTNSLPAYREMGIVNEQRKRIIKAELREKRFLMNRDVCRVPRLC